jgi:DNA-binding FrmR family transcriptional regulator
MHTQNKKQNSHRIKIIEGHIKAIKKMIENDAYCVDIVHQSMAVQRALKKLDMKVLENHLRTHVPHQIKNGKEKQAVEELLSIYDIK